MKAECVRQVANWSHIDPEDRFDKSKFDPEKVATKMAVASPKLQAMLEKIAELDEIDMHREGRRYKHMIFSDVKTMGYGAKIIMSGMLAKGYKNAYDGAFSLDEGKLLQSKGKNVAILCSTPIYDKPIGVRFRKKLLDLFNRRPDNVHGDFLRFIILDQGFKEGIDLFDVKYVHLFEPFITAADEKQAIGRSTRFCGQKGLRFHPNLGWPLQVYKYDVEIPQGIFKDVDQVEDVQTLSELFLKNSGIDMRQLKVANKLDREIMSAAVDAPLTEAVHQFTIEKSRATKSAGGGGAGKHKFRPQAPKTKKTFETMKSYIETHFHQYKWPVATLANQCGYAGPVDVVRPRRNTKTAGAPKFVDFTPSQNFVRHYFQPASIYKGLLLAHSIGTGKTCSAIAIATTGWEPRGYTILWVTRHTLKADIWKNMYHQVCSLVLKGQLRRGEVNIPENAAHTPMKYLSDQWMMPISFKQFSNLCAKKNDLYRKMVKRNGQEDPLKNTLIIIDEAHKLYAPEVVGAEKPDVAAIREAIHHSYKTSGSKSARVLLMSATPYTSNPMDFMRLLNLLREPTQQLPESMDDFSARYLNDAASFTEEGRERFRNDIVGLVSYLNREKDARQFAYPVFHQVKVPMSVSDHMQKQELLDKKQGDLANLKAGVSEGKQSLKDALKRAKQETKEKIQERCGKVPRAQKAECKSAVQKEMEEFQTNLLAELREKLSRDEVRIQEWKEDISALKKDLKKSNKSDGTQELELRKRCGV